MKPGPFRLSLYPAAGGLRTFIFANHHSPGIQAALPVLFLAACCFPALAQTSYFQQEVHYRITAALDDQAHTLQCHVSMRYLNHSPDTLQSILFHLWPNAYSSRHTAFARQALRMKNTRFHFAQDEELGGLSGLDFRVDDMPALLSPDKDNPDIALLQLPKPLLPGQSIVIETPFTLQIPASFSRLGRVGQSYQITQWYPKPAVYDPKGRHPMPYLDLGEFYADFGSFDVRITLPKDYVVAATGVLEEESANNAFKTLRYTADRVHDFAWFADKRFIVKHHELQLPSGRKVDAYAYFTPGNAGLWEDAAHYVARAIEFYSECVGEYPWPQATAVDGALSAGGGMEYPMITIIAGASNARSLDEVITHEVGHNWFYGILASNEREHAWMDEGVNSYYESRYMRKWYGENSALLQLPRFLRNASDMDWEEAAYLLQARRRMDQAPETASNKMGALNYYLGAYSKPAVALRLLEQYIGKAEFDSAMQAYYRDWQFRHPYPGDFRTVMESETGRDLSWLFDGLLFSNKHLDYSIRKSRRQGDDLMVTVRNKGRIAAPLQLSGMKGDSAVLSRWYEGFSDKKELPFPAGNYDRISIDAKRIAPEVYRGNNHLRTSGLLRRVEPLQIRLLPGLENDRRTTLYAFPVLARNVYDGLMAGLLLYNSTLPERRFEFAAVPLYATRSRSPAGTAIAQAHFYPAGNFVHGIHVGANARVFHFNRNENLHYEQQYTRIAPFIRLELARPAASALHRELQWRTLFLRREFPAFGVDGDFLGLLNVGSTIHEWSYAAEDRRVVNPRALRIAVERQKREEFTPDVNYWKASLEWKSAITYDAGRHIRLRFFGGAFVFNSRRNSGAIQPEAFNLTAQGFNDYRFDDFYFGRLERQGLWSQQISLREGGMKALTGQGFATGRSNNFLLALNLSADLPRQFILPLKPYFDIGYFDNAMPSGQNDRFADQLLWSGGLAFELGSGAFGIYLPLINSKNLSDRLAERGNYFRRIAFTLDLHRLNPYEIAKGLLY